MKFLKNLNDFFEHLNEGIEEVKTNFSKSRSCSPPYVARGALAAPPPLGPLWAQALLRSSAPLTTPENSSCLSVRRAPRMMLKIVFYAPKNTENVKIWKNENFHFASLWSPYGFAKF